MNPRLPACCPPAQIHSVTAQNALARGVLVQVRGGGGGGGPSTTGDVIDGRTGERPLAWGAVLEEWLRWRAVGLQDGGPKTAGRPVAESLPMADGPRAID